MAGAGALTFRNGGQTVRDRYAAQMTILTHSRHSAATPVKSRSRHARAMRILLVET